MQRAIPLNRFVALRQPYAHSRTLATMSSYINRPLFQAIKSDHDELRACHKKFVDAKGDPAEREKWVNQFIWEVARHAVGEELVWYPQLEKVLGEEGRRAADNDRAEHQQVKEDVYILQGLQASDPQHEIRFRQVFKELAAHMEKEEQHDLPNFEAQITHEESASIAKSFERTKKFVPTRSHPSAPNKPPFETAVGLMATPIDKLRDLWTAFPDK